MRRYYAYLTFGILNTLWFFWPYVDTGLLEPEVSRWSFAAMLPVVTLLGLAVAEMRAPRDQVVKDAEFVLGHVKLMAITNVSLTIAGLIGILMLHVSFWDVMKTTGVTMVASIPYTVIHTRKVLGY